MADFKKALKEGFDAAKKADSARKEIKAVLGEFKDEILEASGGKLLIELRWFDEPRSFDLRALSALRAAEPERYLALAVCNPTLEKPTYKELARWKESKEGYPCSLVLNFQDRQFEDRTALESGLAELLRDPTVGQILYRTAKQN
jgi:hypothetical protein